MASEKSWYHAVRSILATAMIAFRILFAVGVHSTTAISPALSATKILQLEAIGNSISKEIACCAVSAFSSKYRTIKQELKPACIY